MSLLCLEGLTEDQTVSEARLSYLEVDEFGPIVPIEVGARSHACDELLWAGNSYHNFGGKLCSLGRSHEETWIWVRPCHCSEVDAAMVAFERWIFRVRCDGLSREDRGLWSTSSYQRRQGQHCARFTVGRAPLRLACGNEEIGRDSWVKDRIPE